LNIPFYKSHYYSKKATDLDESDVVAEVKVVAGVDEEVFGAVDVAEFGDPQVGAGAQFDSRYFPDERKY